MAEKIDPARLVTVGTYALTFKDGQPVNRSYIYKLIREDKLQVIEIDKIKFIVLPETGPHPH